MVDVYDNEPNDGEREPAVEAGAAPDPVSVYDRPENTGPAMAPVIITIVMVLLLLVVAYLVLQATVF